jgi:hypothetical protein
VTTPSGAGVAQRLAGYFLPPAAGGPPVAQAPDSPQTPGGYSVLDWTTQAQASTPAGADGLCTVTFGPAPAGELWLADRYTVECTSSSSSDCFVYVGLDIRPANLRDATGSGNLDIADNNSPLLVPGTLSLFFQWRSASLGAIATASVQYRVLG